MSPRSLSLWHMLRRDMGMSYDLKMILNDDVDYSFNSQADLVVSNNKQHILNDDLILGPRQQRRNELHDNDEEIMQTPSPMRQVEATEHTNHEESVDADQRTHKNRQK